MSEFFRFISKKQNYDARHIKIFVHGYLSGTDVYDRSRLLKYIPDLPDDEDALFAFWDSGSMKDMWIDILKSVAGGSFSFGKLNVASSVFSAFKGGVDHFNGKKDYTGEIGRAFFAELKQFAGKYSNLQSVSLYGHSLGARVLIEALLHNQGDTGLKISNLALMGGARELQQQELEHILPQVQGRIYNFYSTSDKVLLAKPSLEKCVGRHPIAEQEGELSHKVFNANLGIGHTDYWGVMRTLFNYVRNEGEHSVRPADMHYPHVVEDVLLFPVLYCAEPEDLQLISRVLATKYSCSIAADCISAEHVAHEVQLMAGNSIANKARGNQGVTYSDMVEDVAGKLKIGTQIGLHTTIEKERLIYLEVIHALKCHAAVTETSQDDSTLLHHYFSDKHCASSIETLSKVLGDLTFEPTGPAFSVTIPLVSLVHYLRMQTGENITQVALVEEEVSLTAQPIGI